MVFSSIWNGIKSHPSVAKTTQTDAKKHKKPQKSPQKNQKVKKAPAQKQDLQKPPYAQEKNMNKHTISVPTTKHMELHRITKAEMQSQYARALSQAEKVLKTVRFWYIADKMILDTSTGLLWDAKPTGSLSYASSINYENLKKDIYGLSFQKVPTTDQLRHLLRKNSFPLQNGGRRIQGKYYWVTQSGYMDVDNLEAFGYGHNGNILRLNGDFESKLEKLIKHASLHNWKFAAYAGADDKQKAEQQLINCLVTLRANSDQNPSLDRVWENVDYISTRLDKLDSLRFTDLDQGMWEFYAPPALQEKYSKVESDISVRARNPELDIQDSSSVAIDFGTSSTVVAIRKNGRDELLRIGMQAKDFKRSEITENDFENPTILELLDIQQLLQAWHSESYRPLVDWSTVHCSHEARTRLRTNDVDPVIVGSMFARLKQWALRDAHQAKVRITDSKNKYEFEFEPLTEHNPVKGQAISLGKKYPKLDPIELYAWFLGMNINWRVRGIFLKYYMTFPVAYPSEVKQKILASFRRGLQRSLPESLVYSERFNEFSVQELASEPAAFAAAALRTLKIEPSKEGTAYAVFDFGGGTTDFDYGIYREPNSEEYDIGFDDVIEHFGSSGDKFLGGENLLENMAYLVFKENQNICREKEISFTKPLDAESFVGSERLISQTQAAYTNTTLLMSKLRPFWESGAIDEMNSGALHLKLLNRQGKRVDCEIIVNQDALLGYLRSRILTGLVGFFTALKSSFEKQQGKLPESVHILLGGNSSRSRIVLGLFGKLDDSDAKALNEMYTKEIEKIFDGQIPEFIVHEPLESSTQNPFKANTKTGVALGLLKVAPGETLKVINHAESTNEDSPFQFYVGSHRRDVLVVGINRGDAYHEWKELGRVRQGIFPLLYTTLPQAESKDGMSRGSQGLYEKNLEFSGNDSQSKLVFARIISPDTIELGLAESLEEANRRIQDVRQITLRV